MSSRFRFSFVAPALVLAAGGLLFPAAGEAKVTCDGRGIPDASVELPGLPREAEAGRHYEVAVDLPEEHAVNRHPALMAVRCGSLDDTSAAARLDGSDSTVFRGISGDDVGSTFDLRFRRPGQWRVASMDVSGHFRDYGFYAVQPASIAAAGTDGLTVMPVILAAGGIAALVGLAIALGRHRRRRPRLAL